MFAAALIFALSNPAFAVPEPVPDPNRAAMASHLYDDARNKYIAGTGTLEDCYQWSLRWSDAVGGKDAWAAHLARMIELSGQVALRVQKGMASADDLSVVQFYVTEARSWH
jgi:hypothetical protein